MFEEMLANDDAAGGVATARAVEPVVQSTATL
jgi:hypothetical protein